jgi:hypothetical protein
MKKFTTSAAIDPAAIVEDASWLRGNTFDRDTPIQRRQVHKDHKKLQIPRSALAARQAKQEINSALEQQAKAT